MTTLAIAALLASLVSKEILAPRLAATIGTAAFTVIELLFLSRPTPVLIAAPVFFLLLWPSLAFIKRATLPLLPVAIIAVIAAVIAVSALRSWLDAELLMRDPATQEKLRELNRINRQFGNRNHGARDAGAPE